MSSTPATFTKSPSAILDYQVVWTAELTAIGGDTITSVCWVVPSGLTQVTTSCVVSGSATIFLSGGTASQTYTITNKIATSGSRTYDKSFFIRVVDTAEI